MFIYINSWIARIFILESTQQRQRRCQNSRDNVKRNTLKWWWRMRKKKRATAEKSDDQKKWKLKRASCKNIDLALGNVVVATNAGRHCRNHCYRVKRLCSIRWRWQRCLAKLLQRTVEEHCNLSFSGWNEIFEWVRDRDKRFWQKWMRKRKIILVLRFLYWQRKRKNELKICVRKMTWSLWLTLSFMARSNRLEFLGQICNWFFCFAFCI